MTETQIQKAVARHFRELEEALQTFTFFAVPGGSVRIPPHIGKQLKDMGVRAGVHDLIFLASSAKCVMIELKKRGQTKSDNQKTFHGIVERLGHASYCIYVDDAQDAIGQITKILGVHGV